MGGRWEHVNVKEPQAKGRTVDGDRWACLRVGGVA